MAKTPYRSLVLVERFREPFIVSGGHRLQSTSNVVRGQGSFLAMCFFTIPRKNSDNVAILLIVRPILTQSGIDTPSEARILKHYF